MIAILTDFINYDPAYSLCQVVANQCKMLSRNGYPPVLIVRQGFDWRHKDDYEARIIEVDPGKIGNNQVNLTENSEREIQALTRQLDVILEDCKVVLTHDLIYQPNQWKYHVAARRLERPDIKWIHWVHSATNMQVVGKTGQYRSELANQFPNSRLVAMHPEEVMRKGNLYGYEVDQIPIIPNPIDFTEDFDPIARAVIDRIKGWQQDIIAVYPARLDEGKQPHIILEIFRELQDIGYKAKVIIVDFHSVAGDKAKYRKKMKREFSDIAFFTSDIEDYYIPHKAVMDLLEYSDIFIHPSRSECDPLTVPEAAWKRCGLVLNFDLPLFRQYDGKALLYKFSSSIDTATGLPGATNVEYGNRQAYMNGVAGGIAYQMENNPVLSLHSQMRKERSLEGVWPKLWSAITI